MKKYKHEAELFKAALLAGVQYAEGRKAVEFEPPIRRAARRSMCIVCSFMTRSFRQCQKSRWARNDPPPACSLVCTSTARGHPLLE